MSQMQAPRGTRDFGPAEMAQRRSIERTMRDAMERFGFQEVQTPTFEHLDLFTAKSGEGIISELYDFEDKGGRHLALRPELTAPVMRLYHEHLTVAPKPLKLYYFGNCFRYDRPQKGRYREFWQIGCELIGADTPEAVAEVVALGVTTLRTAGVSDLVVRVGHLGVLHNALAVAGWPQDADRTALMRLIDKWDEKAVRETLAQADVAMEAVEWFVSLRDATTVEALRAVAERAPSGAAPSRDAMDSAIDALGDLLDATTALGVDVNTATIDPLIARGLDYYTGIVFEMDAPALGAEKQLLGGGQYDLSGVFGGDAVATCGFGLGFDRTLVALEAEGNEAAGMVPIDVYVAPIGDAPRARALALAAALRAAGLRTEVDLMRRNPGKNLKAATTRGARFAVLIGEKELETGGATVKDLDAGTQSTVPLDAVVDAIRSPGPQAP